MVGKAIATLQSMGTPTKEDINSLVTSIKGGMTPAAAAMGIMQNNQSRYQNADKRFMNV